MTYSILFPILTVFILFIFEIAFTYNSEMEFIGLPLYIAVPFLALVYLIKGIYYGVSKKYKKSLSYLITIPFFILGFGWPPVYVINAMFLANYFKIYLHESEYTKVIQRAQPDMRGYKYVEFREGVITPFIVYDESDEIFLFLTSKNKTGVFWEKWGKSSDRSRNCVNEVRRMRGHYYYVLINDEVC